MSEYLIAFFHRVYIFYTWEDALTAQNIYTKHHNYDEFENELEKNHIPFCYDLDWYKDMGNSQCQMAPASL